MTDIREQEMQGKINELTAQKASLEAENKQLRKQVEWLRKAHNVILMTLYSTPPSRNLRRSFVTSATVRPEKPTKTAP